LSQDPHTPRPDPLARRQVPVAGPHVGRILLVAGGGLAIGLAAYMAGRGGGPEPVRLVERPSLATPGPELPGYGDLAPKPAPPEPRFEQPEPKPAPPAPRAERRRDELRDKAMDAGVGGWSRREDRDEPAGAVTAASTAGAAENGAGQGSCVVPPGTPIRAQTLNRVVTERGGILAATVTHDVWGAGFDCLAVPAGSTLTLDYDTAAARGQSRVEVANPVLTRPWPRSDTVALAAMAGDAAGAAGLPGAVEVPWLRTGLLVAASIAVDLGAAALSGGGSLLGILLDRNAGRPLDEAARRALEQAPVVTLEPGRPVVLLLRGSLRTDDFRDVFSDHFQ
jgi:type IV secretion system protein TrbI